MDHNAPPSVNPPESSFDYDHLPPYPNLNLKKHRQLKEEKYSKLPDDERELRETWDKAHEQIPLDSYKPLHLIDHKSYMHILYWPGYFTTGCVFGAAIGFVFFGIPSIYRYRRAVRLNASKASITVASFARYRAWAKTRTMMLNFGLFQFFFEYFGGYFKDWNAPRFWSAMIGGTMAGGFLSMKKSNRVRTFRRGAIIGAVIIGLIEVALGASASRTKAEKLFPLLPEVNFSTNILRSPPPEYPESDDETRETLKIWNNNSSINVFSGVYEYDNRMWSWPDLNLVGVKVDKHPLGISGSEEDAFSLINSTPAYEIGQKDWRSENTSTGRFVNKSLSKDRLGIQGLVVDDLDVFVQRILDTDYTYFDPSLVELAEDLAEVGEMVAKSEGNGERICLEQANTIIPTRSDGLLYKWYNYADYLLFVRSWASNTSPMLHHMQRLMENALFSHSQKPLYMIEDGEIYPPVVEPHLDELRQEILDPKNQVAGSRDFSLKNRPDMDHALRRIFWEINDGTSLPPGLPVGLPNRFYNSSIKI